MKETPRGSASAKKQLADNSSSGQCDQRHAHWNEIFLRNRHDLYHEPLCQLDPPGEN